MGKPICHGIRRDLNIIQSQPSSYRESKLGHAARSPSLYRLSYPGSHDDDDDDNNNNNNRNKIRATNILCQVGNTPTFFSLDPASRLCPERHYLDWAFS
jgi:hypothetical protein